MWDRALTKGQGPPFTSLQAVLALGVRKLRGLKGLCVRRRNWVRSGLNSGSERAHPYLSAHSA